MSPARKQEAVVKLRDQFATSERRACRVLGQPRSSQRRRPRPRADEARLENPVHPIEILATIYHALGIHPETIVYNHLNQPRELVKAQAVTALFA